MASDYVQMLLEIEQFITSKLSGYLNIAPNVPENFVQTFANDVAQRITTFGVVQVSSHQNWNTHYQGSPDLSIFSPNSVYQAIDSHIIPSPMPMNVVLNASPIHASASTAPVSGPSTAPFLAVPYAPPTNVYQMTNWFTRDKRIKCDICGKRVIYLSQHKRQKHPQQ